MSAGPVAEPLQDFNQVAARLELPIEGVLEMRQALEAFHRAASNHRLTPAQRRALMAVVGGEGSGPELDPLPKGREAGLEPASGGGSTGLEPASGEGSTGLEPASGGGPTGLEPASGEGPTGLEPVAPVQRSVLAELMESLQLKPVALDGRDTASTERRGESDEALRAILPKGNPARYQDLGLIGIGGMGEVRRVLDHDLNRVMAMKVIRSDLLRKRSALARFIEEAQATAQLEHPGVVPVHELGQLPDGRYYFTMKEVKGRTLKAVLQEVHEASSGVHWEPAPSGWTFRRLIDGFYKVCEAVAYAHSRGVVHRDLKPSNVMVGNYGEVMVMDWGLARIRGTADPAASEDDPRPVITWRLGQQATHDGVVSGTPAYMPPEQARGEVERLGPASDVYSLGAILYEILSGRPPYEGRDGLEVLGQVLAGPPEPPGRRAKRLEEVTTLSSYQLPETLFERSPERTPLLDGPPLPEELVAICRKAMARDPADRYPDGGAMVVELEAWLEDAQRRERALKVVEEAGGILPRMNRLRAQARERRAEAGSVLEGVRPFDPVDRKKPGWLLEDEARKLEREADLNEVEYLQLLRAALTHVPDLPEAHEKLADYYRAQHAAAEAAQDDRATAQLEILLRSHDRGRHAAYLRGDGAVTVLTDPPGAEVVLYRYGEQDRRLVPERVRTLGRTPLEAITLPMGSYLLKMRAKGRAEVHYPVSIGRQEHWDGVPPGGIEPSPIYLPRQDELGPHDRYVPAGWFWSGGTPDAYFSLPRRRIWVDAFIMRRFQVTNREYCAFLNDLVARGREEEALRWAPRERGDNDQDQAAPIYARNARGRFSVPKNALGESWMLERPAILIDWHAAVAYSAWEAKQSGLRWRLPAELEWEKAARGVDGRLHPWGNFIDPTWACTLESHVGPPQLAEVDSFPIDESPYGVRGMSGNVKDWCLDEMRAEGPSIEGGRALVGVEDAWVGDGVSRVMRGGAWTNSLRIVRVEFRSAAPSTDRFALLGFRLVRSL